MRITDIPKEHREVYLSNGFDNCIKDIVEYLHMDSDDKIIELTIKGNKMVEFLYLCGYLEDDDLDLVNGIIIVTI